MIYRRNFNINRGPGKINATHWDAPIFVVLVKKFHFIVKLAFLMFLSYSKVTEIPNVLLMHLVRVNTMFTLHA